MSKMKKVWKWLSILAPLLMLVVLLLPATQAFALTSQDVTVNATPGYISISNAPSNWTMNDVADAGGKYVLVNTSYYSNPLGDTAVPSDPVVDGECRFTITNSSTILTDLTVNIADFSGGPTMTNSNAGTNGATIFGAYSYCTGMTYSTGKVIAKTAASDPMKVDLAATTNIKWGLTVKTRTNDWDSGSLMTTTATITATGS